MLEHSGYCAVAGFPLHAPVGAANGLLDPMEVCLPTVVKSAVTNDDPERVINSLLQTCAALGVGTDTKQSLVNGTTLTEPVSKAARLLRKNDKKKKKRQRKRRLGRYTFNLSTKVSWYDCYVWFFFSHSSRIWAAKNSASSMSFGQSQLFALTV
jgi:hypothetical protein